MPILSQPSFGPKLSIGFITGGALLDVWVLVWRYTVAPETLNPNMRFWYYGLLLTGVTFIVIGAMIGSIGRSERKAELPPSDETVRAETRVQERAAAHAAGAAPPAPPAAAAPPAAPAPAPPVPGVTPTTNGVVVTR
jgi:hypothetical protein